MDIEKLATAMSGALSPLALVWLVVGYFQQGIELKLNTRALQLQADELANSVREQQEANQHQAKLVQVGQEQLKAELERIQNDRRVERSRNSPRIVFKSTGGSHSGSTSKQTVRLMNVGFSAREVHIHSDADVQMQTHSLPLWPTTTDVSVTIEHPLSTPPSGKKIYVLFTDGRGERMEQSFDIISIQNSAESHCELKLIDAGVSPVDAHSR